MNFFTIERVAEGYAKYRPYYHPLIMKQIRGCTGLEGKFENALDVGCGTGLSTRALLEIAEHVTGTDNSHQMITVAQVKNEDKIPYLYAPAEQLPFQSWTFPVAPLHVSHFVWPALPVPWPVLKIPWPAQPVPWPVQRHALRLPPGSSSFPHGKVVPPPATSSVAQNIASEIPRNALCLAGTADLYNMG